MMDNSQRERQMSQEGRDKLVKDLFKVAAFFLVLKGVKIATDRYC